jgi:hypothetical protein
MSDLRGTNAPDKMNFGVAGKIVGAVVIVAAIAGAGVYTYQSGMWTPHHKVQPVVSNYQLPSPTPPG